MAIMNSTQAADTEIANQLMSLYESAKQTVVSLGYTGEIQWQDAVTGEDFTETDLLREAAWVILCSGFKEAYVRKVFDFISLSFCDWESADLIASRSDQCVDAAIQVFGNKRKVNAIAKLAQQVSEQGFENFKREIITEPISSLQTIPFIGKITSYHLAKNLGFNFAKPDRHVLRLANRHGFADVQEFCNRIAELSGDIRSTVDIVLWRYEAINAVH
ncbi:hypothetical protein RYZ26_19540 [Terasakiella sp. A23]|uniref:hypothetical protein n=1 Tax=Terasakiella sp. FCG-A23 TaxID=3080561 RepID=UPI002952DF3E|nr:hypothetical protein [Terasakiella sp. A23]MDV7341803.1 hypothetical protein [Terasakiella sp. A23]